MSAKSNPTNERSTRRLSGFNVLLIAVLIIQIVVTVVVYVPNNAAVQTARGALLSGFKPENVTALTIHDKDNATQLVFTKNSAGNWVYPKADDFPLSSAQISSLLNKVQALDTSRLIAQNRSSQNRLRVASDAYERLLEISQGNQVDRVYIGSPEGASAAHARLNDQDAVYLTSGLTATDVSTSISSWIDTTYLSVNQANVVHLVVTNKQGTFDFTKGATDWTWSGLAQGQTLTATSVTGMLSQLGTVSLITPFGKTEQEKYGMKTPLATVTVTTQEQVTVQPTATGGAGAAFLNRTPTVPVTQPSITKDVVTTITLTIGAKQDNGNYVAKASQSDYYVEINSILAESFINLDRTQLIVATATPAATIAATAAATAEPTLASTAVATSVPTQAPTPEPTQAATPVATPQATPAPTLAATP